MRSGQPFAIALLAGVVGLMPMDVIAGPNGFLILAKPTPQEPKIYVMDCPVIKPGQNKITCSIDYQAPCKPGACSFQKAANVADYPGVALYGVSGTSTCVWLYDTARREYYPICW